MRSVIRLAITFCTVLTVSLTSATNARPAEVTFVSQDGAYQEALEKFERALHASR